MLKISGAAVRLHGQVAPDCLAGWYTIRPSGDVVFAQNVIIACSGPDWIIVRRVDTLFGLCRTDGVWCVMITDEIRGRFVENPTKHWSTR
jgi:hypothetical protein